MLTLESENPIRNSNRDQMADEYEVDKYLDKVEIELNKSEVKLNDSKQLSQISTILDKLSYPMTFNKTLLTHILDFSNLDMAKPIKLKDFFRAYFSVYENMHKIREARSKENIELSDRINDYKTKLIEIKKAEKDLGNGLTTSSSIQILLKKVMKETLGGFNKVIFRLSQMNELYEFNLNANNKRKIKIKIEDPSFLSNSIVISYIDNSGEQIINTVNMVDLVDVPKQIDHPSFTLSFLLMISKVTCLNKEIAAMEERISNNKESISVINASITQMEIVFKSLFSNGTDSSRVNQVDNGTMNKELNISHGIENIILKIIGRDMVIWESVVFILNKFLLIAVSIEFMRRFDLPTLLFIFWIFGLEFCIISRAYLYKLLFLLMSTMIMDLFWLTYYFINWSAVMDLDGGLMGAVIRKIVIIFSLAALVLKIVICFSLWRMALEYKMHMINKIKLLTSTDDDMNDNAKKEDVFKVRGKSGKPQYFRRDTIIPRIPNSPESQKKTLIRILDDEFINDLK